MCGIAGIFNPKLEFSKKQLESHLLKMTDSVVHRGPDDSGSWISQDHFCALGHRRLSIIDLSPDGKQPMKNERYVITFNGEIYNYRELRAELQSHGITFKTNSDTEVLLASYSHWGKDCISKFDGMYAFSIYDNKDKSLF